MEPDLIHTIIQGAPNLVGMLIAIWILYRIITQNQEDMLDRQTYLEHKIADLQQQMAIIAERLQSEEVK